MGEDSPEWSKRSSIILKDKKYIWFLGMGESKRLNEALNDSDLDAKKNLIENLSDGMNVYQKSNVQDTNKSSSIKTTTYTYSDVLPVPLKNKRIYKTKKSGKWVIYTDIAISIKDEKYIKKYKKKPKYDEALNDHELDGTYYNDYSEEDDLFLDTNHLIHWTPLLTDGLAAASFGYELSFNRRQFALEYHYIGRGGKDTTYSEGSDGYKFEESKKQVITFNYAVSRVYNEVIYLSLGYVTSFTQRGVETVTSDIEDIEEEELSGATAGVKYRKLFNNSQGGYLINARHEQLSGTGFKDEDIEKKNNTVLEFGLFYSF